MELNSEIISAISNAMNYTYINYLPDYRANVSTVSKNGLHANVWAIRAEMVHHSLRNSLTIPVIHIDRKIWDCEAVLDTANNKLYLMITEKNLRICQKEYFRKGFSTHYVFSLLHYNDESKAPTAQLELFRPLTDEQVQYRIDDSNQMLAEWADKVDQVIICAFNEISGAITKATAYLFDDSYNEVESLDISKMLYQTDGASSTPNQPDNKTKIVEEPIEIKLRAEVRSKQEQDERAKSETK